MSGGKVTSNASPSLGANMPPAMQNQAGNFIMNPSMSPAGGYDGGKSFGAEPTSTTSNQPFTPTPYERGPIRTQTERFRGANVGRPPRAGELYGPVAPTMPTPVPDMPTPIADMPITETTPGIEIGFGAGAPTGGPQELYSNYADKVFGTPDASYTLSGGPAGQPITNQPATASMTPQQLYQGYANVIFGTPDASYVPDFQEGVFDQTNNTQIPMIQPAGTYTTAQTPNPFSPAPNLFNNIRQY